MKEFLKEWWGIIAFIAFFVAFLVAGVRWESRENALFVSCVRGDYAACERCATDCGVRYRRDAAVGIIIARRGKDEHL